MTIKPLSWSKLSMRQRFPVAALGAGTLIAGALDMTFAIGFWSTKGVAPSTVLQSVASGVLGRAAFDGGWASALLGLMLHFCIVSFMVLAYYLASLHLRALTLRPLRYGMLYGLLLYVVMNAVVLPLSAASATPPALDSWFIGSVLAHCMLVGVPCALAARRAAHGN